MLVFIIINHEVLKILHRISQKKLKKNCKIKMQLIDMQVIQSRFLRDCLYFSD